MIPELKSLLTDAQIETLITTLCKHEFVSEEDIDAFVTWAEGITLQANCLDLVLDGKLDVFWREGEPAFKTVEEKINVKPGLYRHYKSNVYRVFAVIKHSETLEEFVLYGVYGEEKPTWARPIVNFLDSVEVDGETVPRFEPVCQEK